ncbi:MAG: LysR family transcriptional regulator [Pseudomonadota bacterium]
MRAHHHQFRVFAHVVREGSLSAAANRLGISQSAATQHIAKLEASIGSRLFLRAKSGITLTRAGREFFDLADRYVALSTQIEEKLQGYADLTVGELTLIANAPQPALSLIAAYAAAYPDIRIDFTLYDWTRAMELLRSGQVDIGVVTEPAVNRDWHSHPLVQTRYVLYVRADHRLACETVVSLRELAEEVVLLPERGSFTQRTVASALAQNGITLGRTFRTTTFPVMKEALLQGIGVGIFLANSAVDEHRLIELPIVEMPEHHETCLVVPRHKTDLRLIRSFAEIALNSCEVAKAQRRE